MHIDVNICIWGSQTLRSPSVDALEVHRLQVKDLRMWGVAELVILKRCFCIPLRGTVPPSSPIVLPNYCGSISPTLLQAPWMSTYLLNFQALRRPPFSSEVLVDPQVESATPASAPSSHAYSSFLATALLNSG